MARLVTKFKYFRSNTRKSIGSYAKYIATREGVEKIDVSQKHLPATVAQKKLIAKITKDFPDSKNNSDYNTYLQSKTVDAASKFISHTLERNAEVSGKTYADYIALRPRAERFGSHGLFTDDGVPVQLAKVSRELNDYTGNVYTAIISLRREDANRLGFDQGARWRDLLRSQTQALADSLKIPLVHLRWYAAFHNEGHHPHVHLLAYSIEPREGHLSKQGVAALRAFLAKDIFAQDLLCTYEEQTQQRNNLKQMGRQVIAEIIQSIHCGNYSNSVVEDLLKKLSTQLSKITGKKQYGYLTQGTKQIVDKIIDELAQDARISELYDLWCQSHEKIRQIYDESAHRKTPLSNNREFRSMKNTVIQATLQLVQPETVEAPQLRITVSHLLRVLAQLLQSSIGQQSPEESHVDRKIRRKKQEKEQAHGLKHS